MWSQLSYSLFSESQYGYKALYSSVSNKRHLSNKDIIDPQIQNLINATLDTVCFLDKWPQTKCNVTFDTRF